MSTSNRVIYLIFIASLIFYSTFSFAGGHKSGEKHARHHGMKVWLKEIDLSDAQEDKIDDIKDKYKAAYKKSHKEKMQQSKVMKAQMQNLILSDKFDEAAVRALAEQMAKEEMNKKVMKARQQNEIYNLLTSEQKAQIKANLSKDSNKMRKKVKDKMREE